MITHSPSSAVTSSSSLRVPLLDLRREYEASRGAIDEAVRTCFIHQQWINGPEVRVLEDAVARFLGGGYAVGVSSGTDALVLALRALALQRTGQEYFTRNDVIVTTAFTFTATGDAILRAGATPMFVDIDPETFVLDASHLRAALASEVGTRVVGIIPVHLYGHACDMDAIADIAVAHKIFVLEDCAQAFGARWRHRRIGTLGDAAALSFFPSKNLGGCGDGGMVVTNDAALASLVRMLRQHGGKDKYNVEHVGYNARLDTLQAAILRVKLPNVDAYNSRRRAIAAQYDDGLRGIPSIVTPAVHPAAFHVFHQYTIRVGRGARDGVVEYLTRDGIGTAVYYRTPLHRMALFSGDRSIRMDDLPHTTTAADTVVNLPIAPLQTEEETAAVIASLRAYAQ